MAAPDFARARIGNVLSGKWRLDELLGWGGMAAVYAGTHTRNRIRVAVKVLHPEIGHEGALRQRFLREGYVANSIRHPGIVQVFDDSAEDECVYLVMELLTGKTLKETWKKRDRALPLEEVGRVISSILDVLAAAHAAGIVHRDIKPDNVFLTDDGVVKLLDFGIAAVQELRAAGEHVTTTGTTLGTPAFMPPEQALGKWSLVDQRADIFSVGATARLLLTGRLPHEATGATELLIAAATRRVQPIAAIAPNLPAGIAAVVDRSLGFEREERYQTADEMKRAWDGAIAEAIASGAKPVPLPPVSLPGLPVSWGSGAAAAEPPSSNAQKASSDVVLVQAAPAHGSQGEVTGPPWLGGRHVPGVAPQAPVSSPGAVAPASIDDLGGAVPEALGTSTPSSVSLTEAAVSKDMRLRSISRRGILPFVVVGVGVVIGIVVGALALGGGHSEAGSPSAASASLAGTAAPPTKSESKANEPPTASTLASPATGSASSMTAPSSVATAHTPKAGPTPPSRPATSPPTNCPPMFYGRDMNDRPEYRCCGQPCAH